MPGYKDYGRQVPDDYLAFLSQHDGAGGAVGMIDPAAEVGLGSERNPGLDHVHELGRVRLHRSGEAFAFDVTGHVVLVPWIGDLMDALPQGTFSEFLSRLAEERLFD